MYNLERKKTLYHRFERDGLHTGRVAMISPPEEAVIME